MRTAKLSNMRISFHSQIQRAAVNLLLAYSTMTVPQDVLDALNKLEDSDKGKREASED
jgi:hypothetical protein